MNTGSVMRSYFHAQYYETTLSSWVADKEKFANLPFFVFRGHANKAWPLLTSLEREAKRFDCPPEEIWEREKNVLQKFKSRAHHFLDHSPQENDLVEWLSIIQDYGGPTRLLDFTESFYIASFFALESAGDNDACIWAINGFLLQTAAHTYDLRHNEIGFEAGRQYELNTEEVIRYAESFVSDSSKSNDLVVRIVPPRLNERLAVQKGVFLLTCDLRNSFEFNLCHTLGLSFDSLASSNSKQLPENIDEIMQSRPLDVGIIKIVLPKKIHKEAVDDLCRLNVDAASLFPGLDGFTRSLKHSVHFSRTKLSVGKKNTAE